MVSTPIGNLEDVTLRALRLLREVDLVAAEDTRKARLLMSKHGFKNRVTSYHEVNKRSKLPHLLKLLEEGIDIALISEAGTPGINDPGYELVAACIHSGIPVTPVPGPSAIVTALVVSGLPTDSFIYAGYLPRRTGERRRYLGTLKAVPQTMICLEAPHRLGAALGDLFEVMGDRKIAVCRELTKLHEEVFRGTISQARQHFSEPRGEFTLVVEGARANAATRQEAAGTEAERLLERYRSEGLGAKESVIRVSQETALPKNEVYRMWVRKKNMA